MTDGAFYAVPTRRRRFWRALGFRYHLGDEVEPLEDGSAFRITPRDT